MTNSFMTPLGLLMVMPSEKRDVNPDLLNLLRSIKCFLPVVCQVTHMFSTAPQTSGPPQADKDTFNKITKNTPVGNNTPKSFSSRKSRQIAPFLSAGPKSQAL